MKKVNVIKYERCMGYGTINLNLGLKKGLK